MDFLEEFGRELRRNVEGVRGYFESCKDVNMSNNLPYAGDVLPYVIAPVLLTLSLVEPIVEAPIRSVYKAVRRKE
jgi:hypothetical protein